MKSILAELSRKLLNDINMQEYAYKLTGDWVSSFTRGAASGLPEKDQAEIHRYLCYNLDITE